MPRQGGIYYLPSPPSPYQPDTLAAAEDVNASLNDIATALTGSLPTDGSAAMTGPLNLNGNAITGISSLGTNGPLVAAVIDATTSMNSPQYYGGNIDVSGQILTNASRIISTNTSGAGNNNPSVTVWDINQNFAAGMYLAGGAQLAFGPMDGAGNPDAPDYMSLQTDGSMDVRGTVSAANFATPGEVVAAYIQSNGNLGVNNQLSAGSMVCYGTLTMEQDIYMNGHWLRDVGNILAPGGGQLTVGNALFVAGSIQAISSIQAPSITTTQGGGMSWWFGENGGYGVATSSTGGVYLWQPFLAAVVDQLPRGLTRDLGEGLRAVDTNACLVALFDAVDALSDRLTALEALVPA